MSIDEVLEDFDVWCRCESRECQRAVNYKQSKARLLADIEALLPKQYDIQQGTHQDGRYFEGGYNQAISDVTTALNKMFKE